VIQPGTEGQWNNQSFRVLGRFRAWIEEFVFNYWTIEFADGRLAYLGEGYGLYSIHEKIIADTHHATGAMKKSEPGSKMTLFGDAFLLERKYKCYKLEVEGEVWLPGADIPVQTFEWAHEGGRHLEFIEFTGGDITSFEVHYTSFGMLQAKNLREFEHAEKKFLCSCSNEVVVRTFPFAQSYGCTFCGRRYVLDVTGTYKDLMQLNQVDQKPAIPLGSKGVLNGVNYEVLGFAIKQENNTGGAKWQEYTLFHPTEGFAFLSEYNGHWIFVKERGDAPVLYGSKELSMKYDGEPFQLYNSYSYEVYHALGEFPYNIFNDYSKQVLEYISPPEVWIREKDNREGIMWFLGEHIKSSEVKSAFGNKVKLPPRIGIGAVDPKGFISKEKLFFVTSIALLFMIFAHLLTIPGKREEVLMDRTFSIPDTANTTTFVTGTLNLDKWRSNLQFDIYAPVSNSWFELGAVLVNTATGNEYSIEQGVEYYYGYTDGENWEEGDKNETTYISSIPAGNYQLQLVGTREPGSLVSGFTVRVTYDVSNHRNLLYCILLLLTWPVIRFFIVRQNETKRWENSPYTPFNHED
jgi:hypothetical protein